jgi:ArsR family transcriptional regulator, arsenate/arsenite/antimonite-responsive transcriptional repressor
MSAQALPTQAAGELAPLFKALSDPIRLRLLSLIASTAEICVCDLTDAFEVTGATISHHLRVLREAGMVEAERRGTWVYYRVQKDALDRLGGLLTSTPAEQSTIADPAAGCGPERFDVALDANQDSLISASPDVMRLVADPLRAQIVEILANGPATTSHLVADTGAKQPNVSGHLKLLREAGVVETEPRGRFTFYRLVPEALRGAALHLADLAASARANSGNFRAC